MRALVRSAIVVAALVAGAAAALAWWLSGYVAGDAFQERLRETVRESTGQEPSWASLEVGVFPPRVRVEQARLGDGSALAVARADLRVALLPLLAGAVVVDRVSIEGGVLHAVRTAEGMRWPWQRPAPGGDAAASAPAPGAAPTAAGGEEASDEGSGGFDLAVRSLDIADTRLTLEDRTVDPPVSLALTDVEGRARARGREAVAFSLSARAGEGTLRGEGEVDAAGALDANLALEGLPAATFAPYLDDDARLGGALDGTLALRGPARAPDAADLDVRVGDAAFEIGDAAIRGPVSLKAELRGALARPAGTFALDASGAELVYGGAFRKPPGSSATAEGRIQTAPDGRITTEQVHVRLKNIGGQGRLELGGGRPLAAALDAPPFELTGIGELLPSLAPLAPEGAAALEGLQATVSPLALGGRVVLDGVRVRPGGRGLIELRGALVGEGAGFRSEALVAEAGGQPATLVVAVSGLDAAPRHQTRIALANADAEPLLAALAGASDALTGPVTLAADLAGPLAGGDAALAGLAGTVQLAAGPGRIVGVAPFQMAVEQLEKTIGGLGDRRRQRLQRFYGDRFESLTGRFSVSDGMARSDDLVLRYPGYALELAGTVHLADRGLDARGRLVLEEEAYAALAGEEPEPGGRARVLQLAAVRGTLEDPRVAIDAQAALALVATFATAGKRDKLERKIDGVLGKGAGRGVLDALDGLFAPREPRQ